MNASATRFLFFAWMDVWVGLWTFVDLATREVHLGMVEAHENILNDKFVVNVCY